MTNPIEITVQVVDKMNYIELFISAGLTLVATAAGALIAYNLNKKQSKEEFKRMIAYENVKRIYNITDLSVEEFNKCFTKIRSLSLNIINCHDKDAIEEFRENAELMLNISVRICSALFQEDDFKDDAVIFSQSIYGSAKLISKFISYPSAQAWNDIEQEITRSTVKLNDIKIKVKKKLKDIK